MQTDTVLDEGVVVEDSQNAVDITHDACVVCSPTVTVCGLTDLNPTFNIPRRRENLCEACQDPFNRENYREQHKSCSLLRKQMEGDNDAN